MDNLLVLKTKEEVQSEVVINIDINGEEVKLISTSFLKIKVALGAMLNGDPSDANRRVLEEDNIDYFLNTICNKHALNKVKKDKNFWFYDNKFAIYEMVNKIVIESLGEQGLEQLETK